MGSSQICMLITWNVGSPSQLYNRKRRLLKYEIISSVVWFTLRDAARDAAVCSTRAIHKTRNTTVQPVSSFHYIYMKFTDLFFMYTEMYKDCSCLRLLGYLSSSQHNLNVIDKHSGVIEHIYLLFILWQTFHLTLYLRQPLSGSGAGELNSLSAH